MLKIKYLHSKNYSGYKDNWYNRKYKEGKNIDLFSDLPKRIAMKKHNGYAGINWRPLFNFLESKIGENWNDIYSEIISKTKKRFRYELENLLNYRFYNVIYDDNFMPRNQYGRILSDELFIDSNNILTKKSEEELKIDAKRLKRKLKLQEIFENNESEI